MDILTFIIIGLIAGWVAGALTEGRGFGVLGNIVVGIVGALIGGFILDLANVTAYGFVGSLLMAVLGAVIFLAILNLFRQEPHAPLR